MEGNSRSEDRHELATPTISPDEQRVALGLGTVDGTANGRVGRRRSQVDVTIVEEPTVGGVGNLVLLDTLLGRRKVGGANGTGITSSRSAPDLGAQGRSGTRCGGDGVRNALVGLVGVLGVIRGTEAGNGNQIAGETVVLGLATIEGEAFTDHHEVVVGTEAVNGGLGRLDRGARRRRGVVDRDLAAVDAALGVAPGSERLDGVAELSVHTVVQRVVTGCNRDTGLGHTLV